MTVESGDVGLHVAMRNCIRHSDMRCHMVASDDAHLDIRTPSFVKADVAYRNIALTKRLSKKMIIFGSKNDPFFSGEKFPAKKSCFFHFFHDFV